MLPENSAFQKLESVTLRFTDVPHDWYGFDFVLRHSWLLQLPKASFIQFDENAYGIHKVPDSVYPPVLAHDPSFSNVQGGVFKTASDHDFVKALLLRCDSLKSLEYPPLGTRLALRGLKNFYR
jgi:hypothetical protein